MSFLYYLRVKSGLSVSDLAQMTGYSREHLYKIERGEVRRPRPQIFHSLAKALDVDPVWLAKQYYKEISNESVSSGDDNSRPVAGDSVQAS